MINVLLTKKFFKEDIIYINERIDNEVHLIIPKEYDENELSNLASDADILFGNIITEKILKNAKKLKFVQIPWTGVDNLNFKLLRKYQITVCNSHSNAFAVAEHAIALMFSVAKKIPYHDKQLRLGNWNRPQSDKSPKISPFSSKIFKSNVTIIGYGAIGQTIRYFLSGFDCTFNIVDNFTDKSLKDNNCSFFYPDQLEKAVSNSQYVFISVPLTKSTRKMVDSNFLSLLGNDSFLINISRGEIIDENALFEVLNKKLIKGAALDTWFQYPKPGVIVNLPSNNNQFHKLENLVLSPHRAGFIENELPHLDDAIINIKRLQKGLNPLNIVSLSKEF